jgi:LmbE family N-acetylglucosaminyl deacetylase
VLKLALETSKDSGMTVLCLGAHSDDIEIGCGGTILRLLAERRDVDVHWVVLGSSGERDQEARTSADGFLASARRKNVVDEHFKTSFFPDVGGVVKDFFARLKATVSPDLILTHNRHDLHHDHRVVSDLTWNTFRDHLILEYEILKYDGDLGRPNVFVHLDEKTCQRKVDLLMECFGTQRSKDWFTPDAFLSLARIRGVEARSPGKYAEAFYSRKAVLGSNVI